VVLAVRGDPLSFMALHCIPKQLKAQKRLSKLNYIVYWYGTKDCNRAYKWISPRHIIAYEAAILKHRLHQLPARVRRKLDGQKILSESDQAVIHGYQEMQDDLKLEKSKRRRGVLDFKENYDMVSWADIAELNQEGLFDDSSSDDKDEHNKIAKDDTANIRPNKSDTKYIANDAEETNKDNNQKKRIRIRKEESELSDDEIHVSEAEDAVKKRMKSEETNESSTPSALPAQAPKAATLHQRQHTTELSTRKRNDNMDVDQSKESVGKTAPKRTDKNSELLKQDEWTDELPVEDHSVKMDQDKKLNQLHQNNMMVPSGDANQGVAVTRVVDGGVTDVIHVQLAQINAEMIAETLPVATDPVNGGSTELAQAVKKLMLAMAQLVEVAERPMVAAASHGHSRGVRQTEMLLHTSRRMAEMAEEVASTEPK